MITNKSRTTLNSPVSNTKQAPKIIIIAIEMRMTLFLRKGSSGRTALGKSVSLFREIILGILEGRGHHTFPLSVRHRIRLSRKAVTCGRQHKS
jgi:hypothetical protein